MCIEFKRLPKNCTASLLAAKNDGSTEETRLCAGDTPFFRKNRASEPLTPAPISADNGNRSGSVSCRGALFFRSPRSLTLPGIFPDSCPRRQIGFGSAGFIFVPGLMFCPAAKRVRFSFRSLTADGIIQTEDIFRRASGPPPAHMPRTHQNRVRRAPSDVRHAPYPLP